MSQRSLKLVLSAAILFLEACAGFRETTRKTHDPRFLGPTERLIVNRGGATEPMDVVKNDNPGGDTFLRESAAPIDTDDKALPQLVARMFATVKAEKGVGIAAPQVGVSRQVIVVQRLDREPEKPFVVYLNPEINWSSEETAVEWEGCLSIPAGHGKVKRAAAVVVEYDTEDGGRDSERVSGFVARIFQHEIDHLDGVLFIDKMDPGPLMPKEEYREMRRREKESREGAEKTIKDTMMELKAK
ncbi:MAG: peptide deformylase [Deltaproteobacteria bacterium]|nr:peptide deformylase [Deltaproteobacteria bacterium]